MSVCYHGHTTRQVGCVSCVLVFDNQLPKENKMKAIKKSKPIDVVKFESPKNPPTVVESDGAGGYFVTNKNTGNKTTIQVGDYINITDPNDCYPIPAQYFHDNYNVVKE